MGNICCQNTPLTPNTAESKYFKTLFQIFSEFIGFGTFLLLDLSWFLAVYNIKIREFPF